MTHPFIPLYVDDFEAATAHLTLEEDGLYNRLLRLSWRTPGCSLPTDHAWIARKVRMPLDEFERVGAALLTEFFKVQRGRYVQRRLRDEYENISRKKSARQNAGKKGGDRKALNSKENFPGNATDLPAHTRAFPEPYPEPEPLREDGGVVEREREAISADWPDAAPMAVLVALANSPFLDPTKSPGLITTSSEIVRWELPRPRPRRRLRPRERSHVAVDGVDHGAGPAVDLGGSHGHPGSSKGPRRDRRCCTLRPT